MSERIKNFKRRSISLPIELDEIISIKFQKNNYSFMNDFLIELLELVDLFIIYTFKKIKKNTKKIKSLFLVLTFLNG